MTGGDWGDAGDLVIGTGVQPQRVCCGCPPTGGATDAMLELAKGEMVSLAPADSAGREARALRSGRRDRPARTTPRSTSSRSPIGRRKTLVRGGGSPRYLASGHLVYTKQSDDVRRAVRPRAVGNTRHCRADAGRRRLRRGCGWRAVRRVAHAARWCTAGTPAIDRHRPCNGSNRQGKQEPLLAKPGAYLGTPRVSPDGQRIAITMQDGGNQDIWVYEPQRDAMTRLTLGGISSAIRCGPRRPVRVFGSYGGGILWSARGRRRPAAGAAAEQESSSFRLAFHVRRQAPGVLPARCAIRKSGRFPFEDDSGGLKGGQAGTVPDDEVDRRGRGVFS